MDKQIRLWSCTLLSPKINHLRCCYLTCRYLISKPAQWLLICSSRYFRTFMFILDLILSTYSRFDYKLDYSTFLSTMSLYCLLIYRKTKWMLTESSIVNYLRFRWEIGHWNFFGKIEQSKTQWSKCNAWEKHDNVLTVFIVLLCML